MTIPVKLTLSLQWSLSPANVNGVTSSISTASGNAGVLSKILVSLSFVISISRYPRAVPLIVPMISTLIPNVQAPIVVLISDGELTGHRPTPPVSSWIK